MQIKNKQCYFCSNNIRVVDYKNAEVLRRFIDQSAKITPKRQTGTCAIHQRKLARAIKRARIMSFLPFTA